MIKGLSLQELKDLLDAINHAYFRIDDITLKNMSNIS